MSEEEIKQLKLELKKEILNELTREDYVKDNTWKTLKKEFEKMFYSKGYSKENCEMYTIFNGIQTVLRTSMGYRSVECIPAEEYDKAKKIMFTIFNFYPNKNQK